MLRIKVNNCSVGPHGRGDDEKAIHGTQMATLRSYLHSYISDSVGPQGCVGLTDDTAKMLFDWAFFGTPVVVITEKEKQN